MLLISLDVIGKTQDVTVKMWLTLESTSLSWQHSLESHRTVNSLSSLNAIMTYPLLRMHMPWWVSRDRRRMNHWGGTTGYKSMCACGVTNFCPNSAVRSVIVTPLAVVGDRTAVCWQTSRLLKVLTHKSALPVTHSQIRLGDRLGWFTRGRLSHIRQTQMLWTGMMNLFCYKQCPLSVGPAQIISLKKRYARYMRKLV